MNNKEQFEAWFMDKYDIAGGVLNYDSELVSLSWAVWKAASKASEQQLSVSRREFTAANATIHNLELVGYIDADYADMLKDGDIDKCYLHKECSEGAVPLYLGVGLKNG